MLNFLQGARRALEDYLFKAREPMLLNLEEVCNNGTLLPVLPGQATSLEMSLSSQLAVLIVPPQKEFMLNTLVAECFDDVLQARIQTCLVEHRLQAAKASLMRRYNLALPDEHLSWLLAVFLLPLLLLPLLVFFFLASIIRPNFWSESNFRDHRNDNLPTACCNGFIDSVILSSVPFEPSPFRHALVEACSANHLDVLLKEIKSREDRKRLSSLPEEILCSILEFTIVNILGAGSLVCTPFLFWFVQVDHFSFLTLVRRLPFVRPFGPVSNCQGC